MFDAFVSLSSELVAARKKSTDAHLLVDKMSERPASPKNRDQTSVVLHANVATVAMSSYGDHSLASWIVPNSAELTITTSMDCLKAAVRVLLVFVRVAVSEIVPDEKECPILGVL